MAGAKKRWVLRAVVVALGALLVLAIVLSLRPAERFIYGSVAVGAGEAVFLTRRNEDDATYFWLELVGAGGEPRPRLGL